MAEADGDWKGAFMWLIGLFGLLVNPAIVAPAIMVGALARRWWHLVPGSVAPPFAFFYFSRELIGGEVVQALIASALLGVIWSVVTHSVRRHLTS
ncbi:MAG TPA: hypothetical protein VF655_05430 [Allosphingosinicella sp.]